jgi:hypothetical protein
MQSKRIWMLGLAVCVAAGLFLTSATASGPESRANAVITWNANAGAAALASCIAPSDDPLHESRLYATMHVAIHDALNAIDRRSRPYAFRTRAKQGTSPDAAVASAARNVLVPLLRQIPAPFSQACIDAGVASVETNYARALAEIGDGSAKTRGIELGQAAAAAVLALRADDGSDTPLIVSDYVQGTAPGEWRFTPGAPFAFGPGWGDVTPFVLKDSSQFRPGPPNALTSDKYTQEFNEVKRLGGDGVTTPSDRTADQTEIARFWVESSPSGWNRIARAVATDRGLDPWESARLFGLLNMALADGYVGSFAAKFQVYKFWRPVTAIRSAADDGNPNTAADTTWTPLVQTPAVPDHDSGHSVQGGAAAQVLERVFGTDHVRFQTCSRTLLEGSRCGDSSPVLRRFTSFSQAADENGLSRILVGFHFRTAVVAGIEHGRKIGDRAVDHFMQLADDSASGETKDQGER